MDCTETNETVKGVYVELEVKDRFNKFYEETWKEYNAKSTQLLVET